MQFMNNAAMSSMIIKTVGLFFVTYYSNFKIVNKKIHFDIKSNIIILIIGITLGIIKYQVNHLITTIILIITISTIFSESNLVNSILTTIVSLSINYSIELVVIMICFLIKKVINISNDYVELLIIGVLHIILLCSIFSIKKFKYGISFLQKNTKDEYLDIVVLFISVIILFLAIGIANYGYDMTSTVAVKIIFSAIIMFITIKKSLHIYYKQKLLVQELEETKKELINKTAELKELEAENLNFKKKSHSLIHQQKALEYKIQQILTQTEIGKEEAGEVKDKLEKINEAIYKEKEIIELDKTGITEIDDMLKYMQSECNKNKIEFILQLKGNIHQMVNNAVSKEDLEILLADHIKNAIIAINHTKNINRTIMVKLLKIESIYGIKFYDSGAEFELETLDNLGNKPSTTHAEEGGTGMGFMNTFETLKKYKASLIIEEYNKPSKDNYTKVISINFDNKNEFKIKSYRR